MPVPNYDDEVGRNGDVGSAIAVVDGDEGGEGGVELVEMEGGDEGEEGGAEGDG